MRRLAMALAVLVVASVADAYVIGSRAVFRRFAEKQALDRVPSGGLVGRARLVEQGAPREVPARLELTLPGGCRAVLELPEGAASATLEKGKLVQDRAPAALQALVQLGCPFASMKNMPASEAEAQLVRLAGTMAVDLSVVALSRLGRHSAFVIGAKPRELDRPQVWFDKETTRPLRVVARQGGQLWDIRLADEASMATGRRGPRGIEVWQKGEKVLAVRLMTGGQEKDLGTGAGDETDDEE